MSSLPPHDEHSLPPPPPDAPPQPQHQEDELESGSGSELDSPPRIAIIPSLSPEDLEPGSPTSPPGSPPTPAKVNTAGSLDSVSYEEDPYFDSLVDKFVTAAADVCSSALSDNDIDYDDEIDYAETRQRCVLYAESALNYYNNDDKNQIKYELISGITFCDTLVRMGYYSHVNFTAKGNQPNAKVELFFAELCHDNGTLVPTYVVSLEGIKAVGGLCDSKYDMSYPKGLPIDPKNCYACSRKLKHPKNGDLYKMGHVAMSEYYFG